MLRKRSRAVSSSKPVLMTDSTTTVPSPTPKHTMPITSFLFPTPRLLIGFSPKTSIDYSEAALSPTSILETKPLTLFGNPFFSDRKSITPPPTITTTAEIKHHPWDNGGSNPTGLGLVDVLNNESNDTNSSKPEKRMVLFGSKLRIQVPTIPFNSISPTDSVEFSHSPIEFGIKNRDSQLALYSPGWRSPSLGSEALASSSHRIFTGCLSPREMELSEDYTCVIAHGPNPRTTHIFDNCVVESCGGHGFIGSRKESRFSSDPPQYPSDAFLSFCHACKKNLGQGKDIYIGEKAFCSKECRYQEMFFDEEGMEKCSAELQCPL